MDTHIDRENNNGNVGNNGSNMSLRALVAKTERAMHGMSSRFGDVNSLREQLEQVLALFENQREILAKEVEVLCEKMVEIEKSTGKKLLALKDVVVEDYKSVEQCKAVLVKEIKEIRQMKKELCERLGEVEKVVNKKIKRQKYLWFGVGFLVLSLVLCLGYLCSELRCVSKQVQELKINTGSSMVEVKRVVLLSTTDKATKEGNVVKGKRK